MAFNVWLCCYSEWMIDATGSRVRLSSPTGLLRRVVPAVRTGGTTAQYIWNHPGVRSGRVRAVSRYVAWQTWQRTVRRPVTTKLPGGALMRCYPHSRAASAMLYCRLPEWDTMRFVLDYLRPGDVFVDVGANVGSYTLLAGQLAGVRVVAFEPASSTYSKLAENVRLNPRMDVVLHRYAVGDVDADVFITRGRDTTNQVTSQVADGVLTEPVRMVRLDTVLSDIEVAVVKIDVEGYEPGVLAGAWELVRRCNPALIVERNDLTKLARFFGDVEYQPCHYLPDRRELVAGDVSAGGGRNVVAVPAAMLRTAVRERLA